MNMENIDLNEKTILVTGSAVLLALIYVKDY